jgi:UDP-glucuronate 4-epimerase
VTLSELIGKLGERLGRKPRLRILPMQPGDVDRTWADVTVARRELEWQPETDIDEGLGRFVRWFENQHRAERI